MPKTNTLALEFLADFDQQFALISSRACSSLPGMLESAAISQQQVLAKTLDWKEQLAVQTMALYGRTYDMGKPFLFSEGLAFIPITGVLLNRFPYSFSGATGYNCIRNMFQAAMNDRDVKGIVFDVNSPGGMVQGCFELAEEIYAARKEKPSMSMVDANAYSAAYALASAAGKMIAVPSGGIGSIGVVMMHVSYAKLIEEAGIEVKYIFAGKHKVDGNPYQALPEAVKKQFQKDVNVIYDQFCTTVAKHRKLDKTAVEDTEAQCYVAAEGLELKLIDDTDSPAKAISSFAEKVATQRPPIIPVTGANSMDPKDTTEQPAATGEDKSKATAAATPSAGDAVKAERERISSILGCDEAKGRTKLANRIALKTNMSLAEAKEMLADAEKETAPAAGNGNPFERAMQRGNPDIRPEGTGQDAEAASKDPDLLVNAVRSITGNAKKTA